MTAYVPTELLNAYRDGLERSLEATISQRSSILQRGIGANGGTTVFFSNGRRLVMRYTAGVSSLRQQSVHGWYNKAAATKPLDEQLSAGFLFSMNCQDGPAVMRTNPMEW